MLGADISLDAVLGHPHCFQTDNQYRVSLKLVKFVRRGTCGRIDTTSPLHRYFLCTLYKELCIILAHERELR